MVRRNKDRIEPTLDDVTPTPDNDDFYISPDDRTAMAATKTTKRKKTSAKSGKAKASTSSQPRKRGSSTRGRKGGGNGGKKQRSFLRRAVGFTFYWGFVVGIWAIIGIAGLLAWHAAHLPAVSEWRVPDRPPNVRIVANDGSLLANRGDTGGEALELKYLPDYLPQAVIAIEDRRFRSHFGLDVIGLARAMAVNIASGRLAQGGSTLTQQLAKNLFLTPDRTFTRKMQELVMAFWLEANYTKDQILEMYLNRVYLGAGAYGVDAASRRYFNKSARDVTLSEAAMLAGLLKAPSTYAPNRNPEAATNRASLVINAMRDAGFISGKEAKIALQNPANAAGSTTNGAENYVADWVMDELDDYIGPIETDVVVETTIDPALERYAQDALSKKLDEIDPDKKTLQGAVVAIDGTGAVRALVGGRNYAASEYNRAVAAKRQPGSAFKPFVYLAALEAGLRPDTIRRDAPIKIGKWEPKNYTNKYRGSVTLADALALSLNTIAAQLAVEAGPENVVSTAQRLGIRSDLYASPSIALGTSEVTPLELTGAFVSFANGGYGTVTHVIERISTTDGKALYSRGGNGIGRVIEADLDADMNAMMARTLIIGTGRKAQLDNWMAAGKTGTTQDFRDAWFVGYTANLTAGVWIGRDDAKSMDKITGGSVPAEIWKNFMTAAHQGIQPMPLPGVDTQMIANINEQDIISGRSQASQQRQRGGDFIGREGIARRDDLAPVPARGGGGGLGGFIRGIFGQ
jgi:penicillin-binding protein 1A